MSSFSKIKIGDILTLQRGFDITKKGQSEGVYPVVSSSGINSYHNEYKTKGPGVVIGRKGTLGTAFFIESDFWPHDTSLWVKDFKGNDPKFIYYFLKALPLQKLDSGSANPTLNRNTVHKVDSLAPDLDDQKRIASVLSALDAKIELNNAINAELEGMAKLVYDYWFVQFDFPLTAAQAASLGRPELEGHPYKSSGGPMVQNPTLNRPIPAGWSAGTLENLGEVVGGTTPSKENDAYYCTNGIPWITPKDLSNNKGNKFIDRGEIDVTETGQKESSLKLMPAGTVLLSSRAPIGYTAIATNPLTTNQGFKSFVPNRGYGTDFIYQTLNHYMKLIEQNASGSTFKEISGGTLKAIKIPLPSIELAKLYTDKVAAITAQQQNLEKQNQELTALRDWLLPMLMNGQVTVG